MKEMTGIINHRILLNYRINPEVLQKHLPPEFKVKVVSGYAIGGICQVSLSNMHPKNILFIPGMHSHNAAHRVAVVGSNGEGVYIPRRDTNSLVNSFSGGRLFPGIYSKVGFNVKVDGNRYTIDIKDVGGKQLMFIDAIVTDDLPKGSTFKNTNEVSDFCKNGNIGWSKNKGEKKYDAIELITSEWKMEPMKVFSEYSAYFSDTRKFPKGSVDFDSALIMRNLKHSWISRENLNEMCC